MAVIKKNGSSMGLPMNINRGNPIPIDTTSIWYSLTEAQQYAANGSTAYVGQIISVVDEANNTADIYVITNVTGDLVKIFSGSADDILAQVNQSAANASQAATIAGNYAAQAIQAKQAIDQKIWYGTMEEYNTLETVNSSTIYIILHE